MKTNSRMSITYFLACSAYKVIHKNSDNLLGRHYNSSFIQIFTKTGEHICPCIILTYSYYEVVVTPHLRKQSMTRKKTKPSSDTMPLNSKGIMTVLAEKQKQYKDHNAKNNGQETTIAYTTITHNTRNKSRKPESFIYQIAFLMLEQTLFVCS